MTARRKPLDVALATSVSLPHPDPDEAPLLDALRAAGLKAQSLAWDDPTAVFGDARLTLLRATWNYPDHPAAFRAWLERADGRTALWNPAQAVRWNFHKRYLIRLAAAGVPTVSTVLLHRDARHTLADAAKPHGWRDVVVKPAVGADSRLTRRFRADEFADGEAHLTSILAREDALVQPYVRSVADRGERSLVWIDGEVVDAFRKDPRFAGDPEVVSRCDWSPAEADIARQAVAAAPAPLMYARVDLMHDAVVAPLVAELELIEPSLYFASSPRTLEAMVAAVRRRLAACDD